MRNAVPVCTCLSNTLNVDGKTPTTVSFRSDRSHFARSVNLHIFYIFMKADTLNGLHPLFCSFDRCKSSVHPVSRSALHAVADLWLTKNVLVVEKSTVFKRLEHLHFRGLHTAFLMQTDLGMQVSSLGMHDPVHCLFCFTYFCNA